MDTSTPVRGRERGEGEREGGGRNIDKEDKVEREALLGSCVLNFVTQATVAPVC